MAGKDEALRIVRIELDSLRTRIIDKIKYSGKNASGRTASSLHIKMQDDGGTLWGRNAFEVLETGRRGGKVPQSFTSIIRQWIINKGISVTPIPYKRHPSKKWQPKYTPKERGLMSLSGAIAYKIAKEGTSLHKSGKTDDIYSSEVEITVENIMNKVFGIFERDVEHINLHSNEDSSI